MRSLFLAVVGSALLVVACSEGRAQDGPQTSRSFPVQGFDRIAVSGPFDVTVTTGQALSIQAVGSQRLIDALEVKVEDGRLTIRTRNKDWYKGGAWRRSNATVTISVPQLVQATLAGSGNVEIDRIAGERFSGTVAGSGDLAIGQLAVRDLNLTLAGSGGLTTAGRADKASYSVAGSGDLDAANLSAATASLSVAGSGSIRARVTGQASAAVMGSGDIDITGGARCQQARQGSGSIRCS